MFYNKKATPPPVKLEAKADGEGFAKVQEVNVKGQKITALSDLQRGQLMAKMGLKKMDDFQVEKILKVCSMIEAGHSDEKIERIGSPYCRRRVQDIRATLYPTKKTK